MYALKRLKTRMLRTSPGMTAETKMPGITPGILQSDEASGQRFFKISSTTFLASPKSIMVLSRKNSSFSTPA